MKVKYFSMFLGSIESFSWQNWFLGPDSVGSSGICHVKMCFNCKIRLICNCLLELMWWPHLFFLNRWLLMVKGFLSPIPVACLKSLPMEKLCMKSNSPFSDIISHLLQETMNLFLNLIQRAFLQEQKGFVVSLKVNSFNSFLLGLELLFILLLFVNLQICKLSGWTGPTFLGEYCKSV